MSGQIVLGQLIHHLQETADPKDAALLTRLVLADRSVCTDVFDQKKEAVRFKSLPPWRIATIQFLEWLEVAVHEFWRQSVESLRGDRFAGYRVLITVLYYACVAIACLATLSWFLKFDFRAAFAGIVFAAFISTFMWITSAKGYLAGKLEEDNTYSKIVIAGEDSELRQRALFFALVRRERRLFFGYLSSPLSAKELEEATPNPAFLARLWNQTLCDVWNNLAAPAMPSAVFVLQIEVTATWLLSSLWATLVPEFAISIHSTLVVFGYVAVWHATLKILANVQEWYTIDADDTLKYPHVLPINYWYERFRAAPNKMHFLKEARNRWTLGHDMFVGVIDPAVSKFFCRLIAGYTRLDSWKKLFCAFVCTCTFNSFDNLSAFSMEQATLPAFRVLSVLVSILTLLRIFTALKSTVRWARNYRHKTWRDELLPSPDTQALTQLKNIYRA